MSAHRHRSERHEWQAADAPTINVETWRAIVPPRPVEQPHPEPAAPRCAACRRPRELYQLLVVTEVRRPWRRFHVCRPALLDGRCFGSVVGPASVHRIAQAAP